MKWSFDQLLKLFSKGNYSRLFLQSKHGLERETLRVEAKGDMSKKPHPQELGSPLTNPDITTDFTEAQLELVTPTFNTEEKAVNYLKNIHLFVNKNLDQEFLWPFSMPGRLPKEDKISLAQYGNSYSGKRRTLYREALSYRYGRKVQTVSGIHYNFSFSDEIWDVLYKKFAQKFEGELKFTKKLDEKTRFISESYLHLIRNFLKLGWIYSYLFGASPAIDKSYLKKKKPYLKRHGWRTYYGEYACSLRMSELGYYSKVQSQLAISFNNLEKYLEDLHYAITTPEPKYKNFPGINSNILQQESEHYSRIRPKQVLQEKETPIKALGERGIQYIEARNVDLDPFYPIGINREQLQFLHVFLIYCLFKESPEIHHDKCLVTGNQNQVAIFGRKPDLELCLTEEKNIPMKKWGENILNEMLLVADLLDKNSKKSIYRNLILEQFGKLKNPDLTPSAKIIREMKEKKKSFVELGLELANSHKIFYGKSILSLKTEVDFKKMAEDSLVKQYQIEKIQETLLPGHEDMEISTQILMKEAAKRNVKVEILDRKENFLCLSKGRNVQYVKQATKTGLDSYITYLVMENKNVTNQILRSNGFYVPADLAFTSLDEALDAYPKFADKKVVFKPTTTNHGIGISFAGPNDKEAYENGLIEAFRHAKTVLVEEFAEGEEYRLLVVDYKCISIVKRIPANVIGDAVHTIGELIDIKNADPKYYKFFETYTIKKGATEISHLKLQGLTLKSVPANGERIFLRTNSNVGTGGDPLEVFEQVNKSYKKLAEEAAKIVAARICGVDMIIQNPAEKATKNNYAIIELNFNPALQMHHYPVEGKPVNVAAKVLDLLGF